MVGDSVDGGAAFDGCHRRRVRGFFVPGTNKVAVFPWPGLPWVLALPPELHGKASDSRLRRSGTRDAGVKLRHALGSYPGLVGWWIMGVMDVLDGQAQRVLAEIHRLEAELDGSDLVVLGSQGQPRPNPLLNELRGHRWLLCRLLAPGAGDESVAPAADAVDRLRAEWEHGSRALSA